MHQENSQNLLERALGKVESSLLPPSEDAQQLNDPIGAYNFSLKPFNRLHNMLFQISLADHIRAMQTIYRDSHDEHGLVADLRQDNAGVKLPTKVLLEKIVEGRSRSIALCKLCHGTESLALVKATLDLAGSYSLQGMWPQAQEKLVTLSKFFDILSGDEAQNMLKTNCLRAIDAADRILCVFRVLREYVIHNNGRVNKEFIKKVISELSKLSSHFVEPEDEQKYEAQLTSLITSLHSLYLPERKPNKKELVQSYFDSNAQPSTEEEIPIRLWGEVIHFLRTNCPVMKLWMEDLELGILPQSIANLKLPFRLCDRQRRLVAHPQHLAYCLNLFPSAAKALVDTNLNKVLSQYKVELPLNINVNTGALYYPDQKRTASFVDSIPQQVSYELPITWEEFICYYTLEVCASGYNTQLELLKIQYSTLHGVVSIYCNALEASEVHFRNALSYLEHMGLEMTVVACELYNSIAQMMIMKHRNWMASKKTRIREEVDQWLATEEGMREVRLQKKHIKKQYTLNSAPMSTAEMEMRAKNHVAKKRMAYLSTVGEDVEEMNKALEAASRYLVRSYEILEDTHGANHPTVGTACLAVASVQNIMEQYEDTREWLVRALRYMEKYSPLPLRAISFSQTQLSSMLMKLGHDDESRRVLAKACDFHFNQAMKGIYAHHSQNTSNIPILKNMEVLRGERKKSDGASMKLSIEHHLLLEPILKNSPLYEEIQSALELMNKAMKLSTKCSDKWQASQYAEDIAHLVELAYGWDTVEAAEAYRQVGIRCAAVADWTRACKFLKQSLESHEVVYGKTDIKTISVTKLLHAARKNKITGTAADAEMFETELDPASPSKQPSSPTSPRKSDESPEDRVANNLHLHINISSPVAMEAGATGNYKATDGHNLSSATTQQAFVNKASQNLGDSGRYDDHFYEDEDKEGEGEAAAEEYPRSPLTSSAPNTPQRIK